MSFCRYRTGKVEPLGDLGLYVAENANVRGAVEVLGRLSGEDAARAVFAICWD
jgi:hypothetical protein